MQTPDTYLINFAGGGTVGPSYPNPPTRLCFGPTTPNTATSLSINHVTVSGDVSLPRFKVIYKPDDLQVYNFDPNNLGRFLYVTRDQKLGPLSSRFCAAFNRIPIEGRPVVGRGKVAHIEELLWSLPCPRDMSLCQSLCHRQLSPASNLS